MDSMITAAALALAHGDPLDALSRVALRDDAPALALRGIAMAQLGDLARARQLVRRAARGFGTKEGVARARCLLAEAEIALAMRDLDACTALLADAQSTLDAHGDHANAAHARYLEIRRLLLTGRLIDAEQRLAALDPAGLPRALRAAHELTAAGIAMRRIRAHAARAALARADIHARAAGIAALGAEIEWAARLLDAPAARLVTPEGPRDVLLDEVERLMSSTALVVDGCSSAVHHLGTAIPLARRPVLFALVRTLAEAWPQDAARDALILAAFRIRHPDETHRARLRVEMGRLRTLLRGVAGVRATPRGFQLVPHDGHDVAMLIRPVDDDHASVLALLADGEAWSSSALALALGTSQRTVQRSLEALAGSGKIQGYGQGRARRWSMLPLPGFATTLLLATAPGVT
ncbi:helix-turn-helix domain-containing protein [Massilia sp. NEAU-DD11]|uniref:Helix-turn-helix domain-containing protein n=1 Tax=Massilia cellulosiltytica TaxID=2683234 RepID=A0A7X3G082_9BURK|nr:helix-turn-helix domain-containing protein [Telluria cellulosilytica]MVW61222.1 helix-turn-helix domain-containing protein [Telluria cellulosilytica]